MGTDWINMIREARRVLKTDGKLLIAEVTSRFEKVEEFVKLVESVGFESTGKVSTASFNSVSLHSPRFLGDRRPRELESPYPHSRLLPTVLN
jgi:ubiquinone/menaquinone biosynthesis C-methylase UbiE